MNNFVPHCVVGLLDESLLDESLPYGLFPAENHHVAVFVLPSAAAALHCAFMTSSQFGLPKIDRKSRIRER